MNTNNVEAPMAFTFILTIVYHTHIEGSLSYPNLFIFQYAADFCSGKTGLHYRHYLWGENQEQPDLKIFIYVYWSFIKGGVNRKRRICEHFTMCHLYPEHAVKSSMTQGNL